MISVHKGMSDLDTLEQLLRRRHSAFDRRLGEARGVKARLDATTKEVEELKETVTALDEAIGVLNSYADVRQADLVTKIETLVTEGLKTVFGDDLSFHAVQGTKGKLATTEFVIRSKMGDEVVETPIMDARGGGVAAVAGFLLRLILLLLRPTARPILFLDESFAQLSAEYEPRLAEFIRELVERTNVQIVLVTHSEAYSDLADRVYRFSQKNGQTVVEKEK